MSWLRRRTPAPSLPQNTRASDAIARLMEPPARPTWSGINVDDPGPRECVQRLLAEGSLHGTDLVSWESFEAGIRRSERKRLVGLLEEARVRHADEDNYCTEADLSWDHAIYAVGDEPR